MTTDPAVHRKICGPVCKEQKAVREGRREREREGGGRERDTSFSSIHWFPKA